jgi:hypothetical protein
MPEYRLIRKERTFKSCADAVQKLQKEIKQGIKQAGTRIVWSWNAQCSCSGSQGKWSATLAVSEWKVDVKATTMTLPLISWPSMTAKEKKAIRAVDKALQIHEEGHITVAQNFLTESTPKLFNESATFTGSLTTQQQCQAACDQLQLNLKAYVLKNIEGSSIYKKRVAKYDKVTRHGLTQSKGPANGLPGGKDVVLKCP